MSFAWYSRKNDRGEWEGVLLKGNAHEEYPVGVIPKFSDPDIDDGPGSAPVE
jgi:hypothetical protein